MSRPSTRRRLALAAAAAGAAPLLLTGGPQGALAADEPAPVVHTIPPPPGDDPPLSESATADDGLSYDGITPRAGGTHWVNVKIVVDGAYKDKYANWEDRVRNAVERADNRMADEFGIDFLVREISSWTSAAAGSTCGQQQADLQDVGLGGRDIMFGFTGKKMDAGGCAPILGRRSVIGPLVAEYTWIAVRHEASHLFNGLDRYISVAGDNPNHLDDVMEDPYDHPGRWSDEAGDGDRQRIVDNRARFD